MDKVEVTKCENGFLITNGERVHVCDNLALLGKIIAEALGVVEIKKTRKSRTKKDTVAD